MAERKEVSGVVAAVSSKEWGGEMTHSFRIGEDWYRMGGDRHAEVVQKGNKVAVQYEVKASNQGKVRFEVVSVKLLTEGTAPKAQQSSGGSGREQTDEYWDARNGSIEYQHSQEMALRMVDLLVRNEALVLGTQTKKRVGVIEAAVDRYTAQYFQDIAARGAVARALGAPANVSAVTEDEDSDD